MNNEGADMDSLVKAKHLMQLYEYKEKLRREPDLKFLFLELTMRCNERCLHCGSSCGDVEYDELSVEKYRELLDKVKEDFPKLPMLCITGGEPLLRREFFEIMGYAQSLGYRWGMTSNGTLITPGIAKRLYEYGMKTISVSIDGLEQTHDSFRRTPGGFRKALEGIKNLLEYDFQDVQVTTVVTKKSLPQLDELFQLIEELDVHSWRVINIEPIGRALELDGYALDRDDYRRMFDFIRKKRAMGYPVTYGCSHYLGIDFEKVVRNWYFLCNSGVFTASIMANGDIAGCLDIERREETIQGNILRDDFTDVWKNRFEIFRTPLYEKDDRCRWCESRYFCGGGAYHSWDYDNNRQMVCFKDILF